MMNLPIVGVDPSLCSTGVCCNDHEEPFLIKTTPIDGVEPIRATVMRVDYIMNIIFGLGNCHFIVEAPLLRPMDHSHLFENGIWYGAFVRRVISPSLATFIAPTTLKHFIGCRAKEDVPLAVYKKWGVEFANDRGRDKVHAFALFKLGEALNDGYELDPIKRRGKGGRRKAAKAQSAPQDELGNLSAQVQ